MDLRYNLDIPAPPPRDDIVTINDLKNEVLKLRDEIKELRETIEVLGIQKSFNKIKEHGIQL